MGDTLRLGAPDARLERIADGCAVELPDRSAAHPDAPVTGRRRPLTNRATSDAARCPADSSGAYCSDAARPRPNRKAVRLESRCWFAETTKYSSIAQRSCHPASDRHGAAFGAAGCNRCAGEVHLRQQPVAKNVAVRIGVGRHRNGAHGRFDFAEVFRAGRGGRVH